MTLLIIIAITSLLIAPARSLIGYDCAGKGLNVTTLSLTDIGECSIDEIEPTKEDVYIQLLQLSEFDRIPVLQCKVEIDRTLYYCGMHSHVSVVQNGRKIYIQELGEAGCTRLHETGVITIGTAIIDQNKLNQTSHHSITLAGALSMDGRCSGTQYADGYGSWENVIVQAVVKITMRTFEASVRRSSNTLILPSGTHCSISSGGCMDGEGGETYWPSTVTDSCHFDKYDILYEGIATKLTPKDNTTQPGPIIYTVTTQDTTFALTKTTEISLCGYKLFHTEHPKLLIMETQRGRTFKIRARILVDNLDIFAYVNSKFVYVEKHVKTQLNRLYHDIMEQKCALERQILQNALALASIAPDEMASSIMKTPGYTAVTAGEVLHLIKCVPVECKIRHTDDCYNELPVSHNNASVFLLPRSRIITRTGTTRDCNGLLPAMYKIHDTWFRITSRPIETIPPPIIQPLTKPSWKYVSPNALASSGIYTNEDLDRLKNHIMFPVEKPSMLNTLAKGAMGQYVPPGSISMTNLLDEKTLDRIAESTGKRIWRGFTSFGSASAGVLGIILIIRLAKLIVDTIIHGYALHSIYGWSIHLLGAIWTSVTNLLLHLARKPPKQSGTEEEAATSQPLTEVVPSSSEVSDNRQVSDKQVLDFKDLRAYMHKN